MFNKFRKQIELKRLISQKVRQMTDKMLAEAESKEQLLNSKSDWSMLEALIQKINQQPNLRIKVTLRDGTTLELRCYEEQKKRDYELIDGENYIDVK